MVKKGHVVFINFFANVTFLRGLSGVPQTKVSLSVATIIEGVAAHSAKEFAITHFGYTPTWHLT